MIALARLGRINLFTGQKKSHQGTLEKRVAFVAKIRGFCQDLWGFSPKINVKYIAIKICCQENYSGK
jgi:hypothetical protein